MLGVCVCGMQEEEHVREHRNTIYILLLEHQVNPQDESQVLGHEGAIIRLHCICMKRVRSKTYFLFNF